MPQPLSTFIHPTAILDPDWAIPEGTQIGPYACIEGDVELGTGCEIGPFAILRRGTRLGNQVRVDAGCILGGEPQDLKFKGEASLVRIGDHTRLREYVTINRGTAATGETQVGSHCLIMAYSHIAHDCRLEDGVIVANGVQMGGHVSLGAGSVVSGLTGIHQFVTVGAGAFIGGGLRVDKDVPPGIKALGDPLRWGGVNAMGWERLGFDRAVFPGLDRWYRRLKGMAEIKSMQPEDWQSEWDSAFSGMELPDLARLKDHFDQFIRRSRRSWLKR